MNNQRGVALFFPLAVGFLTYLFLLDLLVQPVVVEKCQEEYGMTCAEKRDQESGTDALLDEPVGEEE